MLLMEPPPSRRCRRTYVDDDELRRVIPRPLEVAASAAMVPVVHGKFSHEPVPVSQQAAIYRRKTIRSTQKLFGLMPSQVTGYGRLGVNRS